MESHSTYSSTSEQCLTTGGHHCLLVHSLLIAASLPGRLHWSPHVVGGWCTCNRTRGSDGVPLPRQVIRTSWLPSWLLSSPPLDHVLRGNQPHVLSNPVEKPKRYRAPGHVSEPCCPGQASGNCRPGQEPDCKLMGT